MAEPVFKRIDKGDGTFEYQEVTDATELPDELVKANPLYTGVLNETIQRRKTIKELTTKISSVAEGKEDAKEDKPEPKSDAPAPVVLDEAALFEKFKQSLLGELAVETIEQKKAREAKEKAVNEAMSANGLVSPNLRLIVANSENPAETAQLLAQSGYRFDPVDGGEVPSVKSTEVSSILDSFKKKYAGK